MLRGSFSSFSFLLGPEQLLLLGPDERERGWHVLSISSTNHPSWALRTCHPLQPPLSLMAIGIWTRGREQPFSQHPPGRQDTDRALEYSFLKAHAGLQGHLQAEGLASSRATAQYRVCSFSSADPDTQKQTTVWIFRFAFVLSCSHFL